MSNADRDLVIERLHVAVGDGRLSLEEFEERLNGVLESRTFGEVERFVHDLPGGPMSVTAPERSELRTTASSLKRRGRWVVPRLLLVTAKAGSVKLDFTDAVITQPVVDIELDVFAGSTVLVLPQGATVDIDNVELIAGSSRVSATMSAFPGAGHHFVIRGKQRAGNLVVRHRRRFWRWQW
ncbi:hypothetical protein Aph01nite_11940 [Acrocarpospora phusangensis]|uniref:DUF1707 domain-containing protein n=2 Tax=Acrocarpospora phusangensis TaxID=1070424 RepID=A0A919Q7Z5_9ACTN|nr:hypothetical protein Aph01nite_11940 [Acrocarpospora phusangensis]